MNRIDRLNALLIHLQGKPSVPIEELEQRFEISRRTVFRDIRSLMEAGVPIGGEAGEGYFIVEGYHLPPVVFNKEEATALLIGSKFVQQHADAQTGDAFEKAMYKIKAVLKYADKEFLENLDDRVMVRPNPMKDQLPDAHIYALQSAIATHRLIHISYHTAHNDQLTERLVEPLGMVYYSSRWHLIGYCRLRQDLRDFRTDRILKVELLKESIDPSKHPNYLEFLNRTLIGTDAKEALIKCTRLVSRFMGEQKYYQGFVKEEKVGDDHLLMTFVVPYYDYFARWLLMYGKDVEIVESDELKAISAQFVQELATHHGIMAEQ